MMYCVNSINITDDVSLRFFSLKDKVKGMQL